MTSTFVCLDLLHVTLSRLRESGACIHAVQRTKYDGFRLVVWEAV